MDATFVSDTFKILSRNKSGIQDGVLTGDLAFRIYDSVGIKGETLNTICNLYGIKFDEGAFQDKMEKVKMASKTATLVKNLSQASSTQAHEKTDDSFKYIFKRVEAHKYQFPLVQTTVSEIVDLKDDLKAVLLPKTCCYGEAGGQVGDCGQISNMDGQKVFQIMDTQLDQKNGYVWHIGISTSLLYLHKIQFVKLISFLF